MEKYGNILSENSPGDDSKKTKHSRNHTITEDDKKRDKYTTATEFDKSIIF